MGSKLVSVLSHKRSKHKGLQRLDLGRQGVLAAPPNQKRERKTPLLAFRRHISVALSHKLHVLCHNGNKKELVVHLYTSCELLGCVCGGQRSALGIVLEELST